MEPPARGAVGGASTTTDQRPRGTSAAGPVRWGTLLLAGISLVAAALTLARFVPLPGPGAAMQAVYPLAGLLAVAVTATWLVRRRWRAAAVTSPAAGCAVLLAIGSLQVSTVPGSGDDLTVMTLNAYYGEADAAALLAEVRRHRPDVLVIVESSSGLMARLRSGGLDQLLPYEAGQADVPDEIAGGTILRTRQPPQIVDPGTSSTFRQPAVRILHAGTPVTVRGVHPLSPGLTRSGPWRADLAALGQWIDAQPVGRPLVMAGDFNASSAHPPFRSATATLHDAMDATGPGWVRTWPQARRLPAFVHLDHVLVRALGVVAAGTFIVPGTDHAGVWARLTLPPGAPSARGTAP